MSKFLTSAFKWLVNNVVGPIVGGHSGPNGGPIQFFGDDNSSTHSNGYSYEPGDLLSGRHSAYNEWYYQTLLNNQQQEYNALEAEKARDFQREMRDTSITSAYKQYDELGVNPLLALGSSGPGVVSATSQAATGSAGEASSGNSAGAIAAAGLSGALAKAIAIIAKS